MDTKLNCSPTMIGSMNCLPTMIGSMPDSDVDKSWQLVARFLKDLPAWPQLPKLSVREDMIIQYSEGFPGATVEGNRVIIKPTDNFDSELERLYTAYLVDDCSGYPTTKEYAAGLHKMLASGISPRAVKGQITGPVTWGLSVIDENKKAIIYDDVLGDAVPKFLRLKAKWQEQALSKLSKNTVIFFDEPYMVSFGSATLTISREKVISMLEEAFQGINGLKGIHCCGNTDWSVLLATSADIISYDAYNYAESLSLYPAEVKKFMDRKGIIAWGIVPNNEENLLKETAASLQDRLEEAMAPFTRKGIPFQKLIEQGILTPSCTLASLSVEGAEQALNILTGLSDRIKKKYMK
ncbi:MAG: methionine synthase [Dehalococcoidales bacterium]|nr:methionine synthase [Dehalococcoidales bacterium]